MGIESKGQRVLRSRILPDGRRAYDADSFFRDDLSVPQKTSLIFRGRRRDFIAYVEEFDEDSDVTKELNARQYGARHTGMYGIDFRRDLEAQNQHKTKK